MHGAIGLMRVEGEMTVSAASLCRVSCRVVYIIVVCCCSHGCRIRMTSHSHTLVRSTSRLDELTPRSAVSSQLTLVYTAVFIRTSSPRIFDMSTSWTADNFDTSIQTSTELSSLPLWKYPAKWQLYSAKYYTINWIILTSRHILNVLSYWAARHMWKPTAVCCFFRTFNLPDRVARHQMYTRG